MVIHSSILAWRIPWTGEPGGLYSPWGCKESDPTEQLTLGLPVRTFGYHKPSRVIGKQDSESIKGWHYSRHLGQEQMQNFPLVFQEPFTN